MSLETPKVIQSANISLAWGLIFLDVIGSTSDHQPPTLLSIGGFSEELPNENVAIREAVDRELKRRRMNSVAVSGMTIFPYDLWIRRGRPGVQKFHSLCVDSLFPRLKARDPRNRLGTYFQRMMRTTGQKAEKLKTVDQLEFIIGLLKNRRRWPRQSALQMSCFDPAKDHTGQPVRGFPCLQQIGISHDSDNSIALHAFYPTQYVFDRGYGNYLGLCHLGRYIAWQSGLKFSRLNCFVGEPRLGDVSKKSLLRLRRIVERTLAENEGGH